MHPVSGAVGLIQIGDGDDVAAAGQRHRRAGVGVDPVADLREAGRHHLPHAKLRADGDEGQKRGRRHVDGQHGGSSDVAAVIKRCVLDGVGAGEAGSRDVVVGAV